MYHVSLQSFQSTPGAKHTFLVFQPPFLGCCLRESDPVEENRNHLQVLARRVRRASRFLSATAPQNSHPSVHQQLTLKGVGVI